ncbi:hypothetical protein GCM10010211_74860 [Streptomyces albospinus]|uniref:Uncharacterized protein n=1 Tax=Streptomyces albospinus TaxID=285515 RepID=A0ABQ2VLH6_9ACTN|nr:hypothetical protein GCM10010211_74860 [Streptomyces albospinus]
MARSARPDPDGMNQDGTAWPPALRCGCTTDTVPTDRSIRRAHERPAFPSHKGVRVNHARTAVATVLAAAAFLGTVALAPGAVADDGRDNAPQHR